MAVSMQTALRRFFHSLNASRLSRYSVRNFSSNPDVITPSSSSSATQNVPQASGGNYKEEREQFLQLLRYSNFINMGDPKDKIVRGKVFHTVQDDLYIDFGWKFYCVCPRPTKDKELYVRNSEVLLRIKELELSSHFLGSKIALTLLEADASIVRLIFSPAKKK